MPRIENATTKHTCLHCGETYSILTAFEDEDNGLCEACDPELNQKESA